MEEELMEMIVEMAVKEVMYCILETKCCKWSRKKWKKVMKEVEVQREDRALRVRRTLERKQSNEKEIFKYAHKLKSTSI